MEAIRALMDWLFENGLDVEVFDDIFAITGGADNREAQVFNGGMTVSWVTQRAIDYHPPP